MSKHTPTPLKIHGIHAQTRHTIISDVNGNFFCSVEKEEDAQNIVKCANNHDAMLKALKDCLEFLCRICARINPQHKDCDGCSETNDWRTLIKQAEEKQ